jgi:hypothetical protein
MTLANMRKNGVRAVRATGKACGHAVCQCVPMLRFFLPWRHRPD